MNSLGVKTLLCLLIFTVAATQLAQGAPRCLRTNKRPGSSCASECQVGSACSHRRKRCLCDGDCGYSCVNPKRKCARPAVGNGRVIFISKRFNATQRTICNPGFKLSGSVTRTCRGNGFWDGKRSRCRKLKRLCADPGSPGLLMRFTYPSKTGFKPGTKLLYYCPPKFILDGSRTLQCGQNGNWSHRLPICQEPKCNQAVPPPNSYVIRPKNWRRLRDYGVRLILGCNPGYALSPQRGEQVCVTPGWRLEPSSFKCLPKSCPDPGLPRNGQRKGLFVFGNKVYFTCNQCYKLKGPSYRQCQANQRWSDSQPTCERVVCPFLRRPANSRITVTSYRCGSSAEYRCSNGYQLDGPRRRTCQSDGSWSGKEPTCNAKRPTTKSTTRPTTRPTKRPTKRPTWSPFVRQTKSPTSKPTTPTTKARFTNVALPVKLTTAAVTLQSSCVFPSLSPEAKVTRVIGQFVLIGCQKQYSVVSSGLMHCIKKSWRALRNVLCVLRGCPFPGVPQNGFKDGLSYLYNNTIKFSCDNCYTLSGHSEIRCLKNGTWSYSQPKCVLKTCLPLKNTTKAIVDHNSLNCGANAIYQCKKKHELMLGSGERTCGDNGAWTGGEPKCVDGFLNIALKKPTVQSSNDRHWPGPASRAVDGNRNPLYSKTSSCTITKNQYGAWWMVDLQKEEPVAMVIVVNRKKPYYYRHLNDFEVFVGNDVDGRKNSKCGGVGRPGNGQTMKIKCPRTLKGRYVSVYLPVNRDSRLTLCEVEVYRSQF